MKMKKLFLILSAAVVLSLCAACAKNNAQETSPKKEYTLTKKSYYLDGKPEFMGRAMNFAYQEYSGFKTPVLTYPAYGFVRKNAVDALEFINISKKRITGAEIFLRGTGNTEDKELQVTFDDFDFVPGSNCTVKLHDSFLKDNEYKIGKITFRYDDSTEQTASADEMNMDWILSPLDLTGSGLFFITDPGTGTYHFVVKTSTPDSESTGNYKITATKQDGEKIKTEGEIHYWDEEDVFSVNIWEKIEIGQLCDLKKLEIEFSANGKVFREEVTDVTQLEKITMWVAAFCYYGYR